MSTDLDTVFHPEIKHRPGWRKALPWVIGVVVVGALIAGDHLVEHRPLDRDPADEQTGH